MGAGRSTVWRGQFTGEPEPTSVAETTRPATADTVNERGAHGRGGLLVVTFTLVYQHGDDPLQRLSLDRGGEMRVAFGRPDRRAAVWKVVASRKGDVYVMERSTGRYLKVSLHESRDWRFQWIVDGGGARSPFVESVVEQRGTRIIDQWDRPPPAVADTLTTGFTIWTSGDDVVPANPDGAPTRDMVWVPPPSSDEMGFFTVAFMRPTGRVVNFKGYLPVAAFAMDSGEAAMILASRRPMRPDERDQLVQHRDRLSLARTKLEEVRGEPLPDSYRVMLHGKADDGARFVLDLSM